MAEQWITATWGDVALKDFVRKGGVVYRCDGWTALEGAKRRLDLYSPSTGAISGSVAASGPVDIRIATESGLTAAGKRFDGLSAEGARALKEKLGAEMIAMSPPGDERFTPQILAERYAPSQLASHLRLFHGLAVADVKTDELPELRATHREFHAVDPATHPHTAARIPHVHDERAFQKEVPK